MGAKDTNSRQTRNQLKCTTCGQLFRSSDALRSHTAKSHSTVLKATATNVKTTTASKADIEKIIQHAEKPKRVIRVGDNIATLTTNGSVQVRKSLPMEARSVETRSPSEQISFSFQCPKCVNKYPSYITAYRHIQSCHCVNKAGLPVEADSPHLIKPIKFKLCLICKHECVWNEVHNCKESKAAATPKKPVETAAKSPAVTAVVVAGYMCSGCGQEFDDLRQFDLHIPHAHTLLHSLFFSNVKEFTKWKADMEDTTKTNYQMKAKYEEKKYFRCGMLSSFVTHRKKKMLLYCPSVIILQEYMTGLQVHFYREHARHACNAYMLPKTHKKHLISNFFKSKDDATATASVDADLYVQFKTVMESVIMEAAKIDRSHLRMLQGKALGMTMILNNYIVDQGDSDDDFSRDEIVAKDFTEPDSLKDKIEEIEPVEVKRNVNNVVGKKIVKMINPDDEIQRIEEVRSSQRLKRRGEDVTPVQKVLPTKRSKRSATVSETKRDSTPEQEFLQVTTNVTIEAMPKTGTDKKSDAKKSTPKPKSLKKHTDLEKAIEESNNSSPSVIKKASEWFPKSPSFSFADQYKDFVKKNFATDPEKIVKKNKKIRTKLGQFKPSLSPKQRSQSIDSPSPKKSIRKSTESPVPKKSIRKSIESPAPKKLISKSINSPAPKKSISKSIDSPAPKKSIRKSTASPAPKKSISKPIDTPAPKKSISKSIESPAPKKSISKSIDSPSSKKSSSEVSSPATKAAKIVSYEVKEQENDCNILILKI